MLIAIWYRKEIRLFKYADCCVTEALISAITRVLGQGPDKHILPDLELLTDDEIVDYCLDYDIYVTGEIE